MNAFFFFLILLALVPLDISSQSGENKKHKIIYMFSPPRSLSVAFLRMMEARGDFGIFNEPAQYAYDKIYYPELTKEWFRAEAASTYSELKEQLYGQAQSRQIFVKEMSFAVEEFLAQNLDFIKNPDVHFVCMIRNPHHSVISYYNKIRMVCENASYIVGYKACYNIVELVKKYSPNQLTIIHTEDLYNNPHKTIEKFCEELSIPFKPEALTWSAESSAFDGNRWHEIKHNPILHHWHGEAIRSSGFGKPHEYNVDAHGQPTFIEIENLEHRKKFKEIYQENLHYYNLINKSELKN